MLSKMMATTVLGLVLTFTSATICAQELPHVSQPVLDQDPSELAPAPSTWKGAVADSLRLLLLEHSTRVAFQDKTRRELGGTFFSAYVRSLKIPDTGEDGDSWRVNYIGHPIHGAAAGFIWLDHEDGAHDPKLGFSKEYWTGRGRATVWAALYGVQFEFGPFSEASIGNVGLRPQYDWLGRSCGHTCWSAWVHGWRGCARPVRDHED